MKKFDKNDECDKYNKVFVGNFILVSFFVEVLGILGLDDGILKFVIFEGLGLEYYCVLDDDDDSFIWVNYSWEDDMYGGIYICRIVRDFILLVKILKDSDKNLLLENSDILLLLLS